MKSRIIEIDVMRGMGILFVILGHAFIVHPIDISQVPWCHIIDNIIDTFHMELLFLVSGLCYSCKDYLPFIKKKLHRIGLPYLIFGLITLFLHSFGGDAVNNHSSIRDGLIKLMNGGNYWFLYTLFLIFLVYPLIERICNDYKKKIVALILLSLIGNSFDIPNYIQMKNVLYQLPYFMTGAIIKDIVKERHFLSDKKCISLSVSILAYLVISCVEFLLDCNLYCLIYARCLSAIFIIYNISLLITDSTKKAISLFRDFLCVCSKYSLQLYLFNGFFLVLFRIIIVSVMHIYNPALIVIGIFAGNVILSLSVCWIAQKTKYLKYLIGL